MTALASRNLDLEGAYVSLEQLLALRHVPLAALRRNLLAHSGHGGTRQSRHRGRGIDFAEVRLYQPGDDVRSIDWRVTARKARPHTKVFREERERPTLLVVDQSQSMFFGSVRRLKSVLAAEACALLAWHGLELGERVGGIVIGNDTEQVLKPHRSTRAVVRLLGAVARSNNALDRSTQSEQRLLVALSHAHRVAPRGHRLFLISDLAEFDTPHRELLLNLGRFNDFTLIFTEDPLERDLPPADQYAVTDGRARVELFSGLESLRGRYHDAHAQRLENVRATCRQGGIRMLVLATDADVARQIAAYAGA